MAELKKLTNQDKGFKCYSSPIFQSPFKDVYCLQMEVLHFDIQ